MFLVRENSTTYENNGKEIYLSIQQREYIYPGRRNLRKQQQEASRNRDEKSSSRRNLREDAYEDKERKREKKDYSKN